MRRLRERADEEEIHVVGHCLDEIFITDIAHEGDVMAFLFAPHGDDLRHDAGEIGLHDPRVQGAGRTYRDRVDDLDTELSAHRFSCVVEGRFPDPEPLLDSARCRCRPPPCPPPRHPQRRGVGRDALRQRQARGVTLHYSARDTLTASPARPSCRPCPAATLSSTARRSATRSVYASSAAVMAAKMVGHRNTSWPWTSQETCGTWDCSSPVQ